MNGAQDFAKIDERSSIQAKSQNCGTSGGGNSYDQEAVIAPSEMTFPSVFSWVEQADRFSRSWIEGHRLVALVPIAASASKCKIL